MRIHVPVSFIVALSLAPALAQETSPPNPDEARRAAMNALREAERPLEKALPKCAACKGAGEVKERPCRDCESRGYQFKGELQAYLNAYVAYCTVLEQHQAVLAAEKSLAERSEQNRLRYLRTILEHISTDTLGRPNRAHSALSRRGAARSETYTRLAVELAADLPNHAVGQSIAFDARVQKVKTIDGRGLAEVRIQSPGGEMRLCQVLLPADAKWTEGTRVRIIGEIIAAEAERKAFDVDAETAVIRPVAGTGEQK